MLVVLTGSLLASAQVGTRPASNIDNETIEWMKKVADWQLTQASWDSSVSWERGAMHAGLMACYEATKDEKYLDKCRQYAQKFNWQLGSASHHADNNAVSQVFMELYLLDQQDPARFAYFKNVSDLHIAVWPTFNCNVAGGNETWWWCDALFMAPPGLVRLSRALDDTRYTDFMHKMWADTQSCLYDTEQHLFFRDINYFNLRNCNDDSIFWSRGNGWVLAGLARVLQYLPVDDPNRPAYVTLFQEMSAKLITLQQPDGYWRSDLLGPNCHDNPESSGTGFFTFGLAWGINNGLLDETTYGPAIEAGWAALRAAVQPSGLLGWVQPVGAGPTGTSATTTDVFGVGAYLLAGSEVQKYLLAQDPNSIEYFESYVDDAALTAAWNDGSINGTSSQIKLGDYGDNFMELAYRNDLPPYHSETSRTFASPRDITANNPYYLSILVRGPAANAAEQLYVRLTDVQADSAVQFMSNPNVVQTAAWTELAFPLSGFAQVDLTRISKLSIGVGTPGGSVPTGQGTLRIDNIRLEKRHCAAAPEDLVGDCRIDLIDFAVIAGEWLNDYRLIIEPADPGTTDRVAYWSMDGHYNDADGDYNALPLGNPSFITPGQSGQSVYFNGASALNVQSSIAMNLSSGATVSAWVKSGGMNNAWNCVVAKGLNSWRLLRNNTGNTVSFHFSRASGGGEYQANGMTAILDNQWHHILGVYDGSQVRLYVDGRLDVSSPAGAVSTSNDPVYIGSRAGRLSDRSWQGEIDEVHIYNTALSDSNILYLAESAPLVVITQSKPADLMYDGVIDIYDLHVLALSWLQDQFWP